MPPHPGQPAHPSYPGAAPAGPPGFGPPGGGPPPGQPYPGYIPQPDGRDHTTLYGVLSIVIAVICCAPLGILFGYLSIQEAKKHGKDQTLGKVGLWLSIVLTALWLIAAVLGVCFGAFGSWNVNNNNPNY
jgi:hypothetical protein